ncbi:hypothetical protein BCIN_04g01730 [Botrytis cinerea B05.10]|uniref:Uncharacterized protein n=1 Tax=Botryotinia fuckeliana (strain B05.10) TaxID=332648 RepID=A0A384JEE3_BOTFB|nr:hypothetical protein BCIN_04g01730 [Botrytis cinerea B05.10]ATZ48966.1 hypothetical protein BCIN_04g01730 [Botrytis cinerea B05.10]
MQQLNINPSIQSLRKTVRDTIQNSQPRIQVFNHPYISPTAAHTFTCLPTYTHNYVVHWKTHNFPKRPRMIPSCEQVTCAVSSPKYLYINSSERKREELPSYYVVNCTSNSHPF